MKSIQTETFRILTLVLLAGAFMQPVGAATIAASSCSESAVQSAINSARDGDTVTVPAGSCSWNSEIRINKGIHLRGAGPSSTRITMGGGTIRLTKQSSHSVRLSGFTFTRTGGGSASRILVVSGAWRGAPPLIHDNVFNVDGAVAIRYETNGGVIYNNVFNGIWDEVGIQHKQANDRESWSTSDTMGMRDESGTLNLYVEDNTFNNLTNGATDFDDAARIVFRYNTVNSSSFNSHGLATSPVGIRHFEVYGNDFNYPNKNVNQNWFIWIRGGTGVIFNNDVDDLNGQQWGNKSELLFSVRAAVDGGVNGCCTSYPCQHQVGQNHDGSHQFLDPVRIWGNRGTLAHGHNGGWQNTCGQNMNNYIREGRDYVFSAKSGYTPFTYPHPLRNDETQPSIPAKPKPPTDLTVLK